MPSLAVSELYTPSVTAIPDAEKQLDESSNNASSHAPSGCGDMRDVHEVHEPVSPTSNPGEPIPAGDSGSSSWWCWHG